MMMPSMFLVTFFYLFLFSSFATSSESKFVFNGFSGDKLSLDGNASIASNGLLSLTNKTMNELGHAFHQTPLNFKSPVGKTLPFSITFVFAISSQYSDLSGHGIASIASNGLLSLTNKTMNELGHAFHQTPLNFKSPVGKTLSFSTDSTTFVFAISSQYSDLSGHGIAFPISPTTNFSTALPSQFLGFFIPENYGKPMPMCAYFADEDMPLNVTISPEAEPLDYAKLNVTISPEAEPQLPSFAAGTSKSWRFLWLTLVICSIILMVVATLIFLIRRRAKYAELLEDWEREYVAHRFPYKDLFRATRGFNVKELVGVGGFGSVFRGVLPPSNREVAVKRVSHESGSQGMKEFVAEIVSIGQLRHRNIAQLLGYCRRKGELLLVYDLMPNSSLDKYLYDHSKPTLDWARRFGIIKGVASALIYLHEEWEKVVIHRDIKASNVLLDGEWNAKLGDFGLARSCQHGIDPRSIRIIGTIGYLAPELSRTGRSSTMTDVFAFGAFLLEVACGRRPLVLEAQGEKLVLVDWVLENWKEGTVLATMDPRLAEEGSVALAEIEMVLILGLLCSHPVPEARPSMRQVTRFLDGDETIPELSPAYISYNYPSLIQNNAIYGDYI